MTPAQHFSLPGQVASHAEFIVKNIRQTDYTRRENIDMFSGVYECDCAGLLGFLLEGIAPEHYATIPKRGRTLRPAAVEYYDFFSSLTPESIGWRRIEFLHEVRRGDIIAWRFAESPQTHEDGHVSVVAEAPGLKESRIFAVKAYDSSVTPHFDDTRLRGPGKFASGVGAGFINFMIDDMGRPVAFRFGPYTEEFVTSPIKIGRIQPLL